MSTMMHPCCGSSLKQGTKFLALLSMALSVMGAILSGIYLVQPTGLKNDSDTAQVEYALYITIEAYCNDSIIPDSFMIFIILVVCILNLFFAIMLFIGAEQENLRVCQFWWRISLVLCLVDIVFLIISAAVCTANVTDIVINTAGILRSIYELWVVHAFNSELRQKEESNGCRVVVSMA